MGQIFTSQYIERPEAEARFKACYNLDKISEDRLDNLWQFVTILTLFQGFSLIAIGWLIWQVKGQ